MKCHYGELSLAREFVEDCHAPKPNLPYCSGCMCYYAATVEEITEAITYLWEHFHVKYKLVLTDEGYYMDHAS